MTTGVHASAPSVAPFDIAGLQNLRHPRLAD